MLGKYVTVRVTKPMHSFDAENGIRNELNFGKVESGMDPRNPVKGAYIMGVNHRVRLFEGRVIAVIKRKNDGGIFLVVAPKSKRFIVHDIEDAIAYAEKEGTYELDCIYETSCGAVVYRIINGEVRFLLIKNKRSLNWGFPKGHMERGEDEHMTAYREVLEESGIRIEFLPDFRFKSEYSIQNRIEKKVIIFLATTKDTRTVIQQEEIEEYLWLGFQKAMDVLRFPNDKQILIKANDYLAKEGIADAGTNC
ncbi:MAG: NUDIX domain-containing protein [Oscillospiraceae bacterium]|nr:NUDIX domain-containing protein [Oscillospiraceae bacterium]